jgi:hypothetical protein
VIAFLAITAFVSVPPLLRLFNNADLSSKAVYAVIGQYGRQSGLVTLNDAGVPELASNLTDRLQALNSDVLFAAGAATDLTAISLLQRFESRCDEPGDLLADDPEGQNCQVLGPGSDRRTCNSLEKDILKQVVVDCGQCQRAMPFVLGVAVLKAPLTQESKPVASGCPPVRPMPLQQGRSGLIRLGSDSNSGGAGSSSGQSSSSTSSSSSSSSASSSSSHTSSSSASSSSSSRSSERP